MATQVYILHFDYPLRGTKIQHYAGCTSVGIAKRMWRHRNGPNGYVRRIIKSGNNFQVVHIENFKTPKEAFLREKELKREGKLKTYCFICRRGKK